MPLFTKILSALTDIIERVEKEIREHEESREFRSSQVCQPRMSFDDPDYRDDPEQWKFTVRRTDWEDFAYCIEFKGSEFDRFHAGD